MATRIHHGFIRSVLMAAGIAACAITGTGVGNAADPSPLLQQGQPVDWWFVFKFNARTFPGCRAPATRSCPFGGQPQDYPKAEGFGQQYVFASSANPTLQEGGGCAGDTTTDPVGATFGQVYNGAFHYLIWNDQFYKDPKITGCSQECGSPWGHSKGMLAWNDSGEGFVLQVSTPSWPASGSSKHRRKTDGNTLGCIKDDDVEVSQHFFALKITKNDLVIILKALANASVVTDPSNPQLVNNGGPADVRQLVSALGDESKSQVALTEPLSSGVTLISKPSARHVPPWQMVSAILGGVSLRTATWWTRPAIPTTTAATPIACWDDPSRPGAVEIALTGSWNGQAIGLTGGASPNHNHAKLGVSTSGAAPYAVFGDMNQQGSLSGPHCASSQNGRGGLFYALPNQALHDGVRDLISGETAPQ